jgi:hypothetical protein
MEFPLALLQVGQKRFVEWLRSYRRREAGLTDEQSIWFLYDTASNIAVGVGETYLVRPEWQQQFPGALASRTEERRFLRWLRGQFPDWAALREVKHIRCVPLRERLPFCIGDPCVAQIFT